MYVPLSHGSPLSRCHIQSREYQQLTIKLPQIPPMFIPILQAAVTKNVPPPFVQHVSICHQRELLKGKPKQMVQHNLRACLHVHEAETLKMIRGCKLYCYYVGDRVMERCERERASFNTRVSYLFNEINNRNCKLQSCSNTLKQQTMEELNLLFA